MWVRNSSVVRSEIPMHELTRRQQDVFNFVRVYKDQQGVPPTLREIARHFGFRSATAAADHLRALREKGYLTNKPRQARSHQVLVSRQPTRRAVTEIPLYGSIPMCSADRRLDGTEGCIAIDTLQLGLQRGEQLFAVRVRGNSMAACQIMDGDIALLSRTRATQHGCVVAVLIDNQSSFKTLLIENDEHFLQTNGLGTANLIPATAGIIQGILVALIRQCSRAPVCAVTESRVGAWSAL